MWGFHNLFLNGQQMLRWTFIWRNKTTGFSHVFFLLRGKWGKRNNWLPSFFFLLLLQAALFRWCICIVRCSIHQPYLLHVSGCDFFFQVLVCQLHLEVALFGWMWLIAGANLLWEKIIADRLVADVDLVWEKSTAGWQARWTEQMLASSLSILVVHLPLSNFREC